MKKMTALLVMIILPLIAGCGGGGGKAAPTVAVLKISATGNIPAGNAVAGIGASLELPKGVTVKTDATGAVDPSVVVPSGLFAGSGNASLGPVSYTAATATTNAKLDFTIASNAANGVGAGEYVTITFILNSVSPVAADFNFLSFTIDALPLHDNALQAVLTPALALSVY